MMASLGSFEHPSTENHPRIHKLRDRYTWGTAIDVLSGEQGTATQRTKTKRVLAFVLSTWSTNNIFRRLLTLVFTGFGRQVVRRPFLLMLSRIRRLSPDNDTACGADCAHPRQRVNRTRNIQRRRVCRKAKGAGQKQRRQATKSGAKFLSDLDFRSNCKQTAPPLSLYCTHKLFGPTTPHDGPAKVTHFLHAEPT